MNGNDPIAQFLQERKELIEAQRNNKTLRDLSNQWLVESWKGKYSYNFSWMGRPIIQYPQDMIAIQEIIWQVKPDLIIETGIAHGGSIVYYASLLELIGSDGIVLGIDVDIRAHNRREIEQHPMIRRIRMIEGSSIAPEIVQQVSAIATGRKKILVCLDSNHTHEHVLNELKLYAPFVTKDSYLVVFDTIVEQLDDALLTDRPWRKGNNPLTAVQEYLRTSDRFIQDSEIEHKILLTMASGGYLRCIK